MSVASFVDWSIHKGSNRKAVTITRFAARSPVVDEVAWAGLLFAR